MPWRKEVTHLAWDKSCLSVLEDMKKRYGEPQEVTDHFAIWYHNTPWKRTVVYRDAVPHYFPELHHDILSQTVDYPVPLEKVQELADFDGSLVVDRTKGELTAHCNNEEMNRTLLNLAHDIVINKRTPVEAREALASVFGSLKVRWAQGLPTNLHFEKFDPQYEARDPEFSRR